METLDLNIDNYELQDILNLFKIPLAFNEQDLKQAKLTVLQMHPDKSRLPKEYFLFFSKAYKMLFEIYKVRYPDRKVIENEKYSYNNIINRELGQSMSKNSMIKEDREYYKKQDEAFDKLTKMNSSQFNTWFNEKFEKFRMHDAEQDSGYEDWFRNNNNDDEEKNINENSTWNDRAKEIERKKEELRNKLSIISRDELQSFNHTGHYYELGREQPAEHSSGLFSSLQYEDLKKAHTETVIPVTIEDYNKRQQYKSVGDFKIFRDNETNKYDFNADNSKIKMENIKSIQQQEDVRRAYLIAKQDEIARQLNKNFKSEFMQLMN